MILSVLPSQKPRSAHPEIVAKSNEEAVNVPPPLARDPSAKAGTTPVGTSNPSRERARRFCCWRLDYVLLLVLEKEKQTSCSRLPRPTLPTQAVDLLPRVVRLPAKSLNHRRGILLKTILWLRELLKAPKEQARKTLTSPTAPRFPHKQWIFHLGLFVCRRKSLGLCRGVLICLLNLERFSLLL